MPVLPITPVDTTGAGDTFVGVLTAWLDGGAPLVDALRAASVAGACNCEQVGAQTAQPTPGADPGPPAAAAAGHPAVKAPA